MFSFLRAAPPRTRVAHLDTVTYDADHSSITFLPRSHAKLIRVTFPGRSVGPGTRSIIVPPLHWHRTQDEEFDVVAGTLLATVNGKRFEVSAGRNVIVPRRAFHMFENASETEACTVDITLDPKNWESEMRLFRNFYKYVDENPRPNVFQILLFLHESGTCLAIPVLPRSIADPLSRLMGWAGGVVVGKYLLGFKGTYPEYYDEKAEGCAN